MRKKNANASSSRRSATRILIAAGPLLVGGLAQAQDAPGEAGPQSIQLDALTVEARSPARSADGALPPAFAGGQIARGGRIGLLGNKDSLQTPFSTASYTAQTIRDQQAVSVAEILTRLDPSVRASIGSGNRYDAVTIRGFRVENREFALNGLYGLVPDYRINPAPIERIELLKGPSAFLFGVPLNGSVGGTVNVVTKRAGDAPLTRATVDYASAAIAGTQFDVARRYGEERQIGIRVNGAMLGGDTPIDGNGQRNGAGSLALDYTGDRFRFTADVIDQNDRYDRPTRGYSPVPGFRIPRAPDPRINLAQRFDFSDAESLTALGRAEYDLTRDITLFAALGSNRFAYDKQESPSPTLLDAAGNASSVSVFQSGQTRTLSGEAGARARFETGSIGHEAVFTATVLDQDLTLGQITYPRYRTNIYTRVLLPFPGLPVATGSFPRGRSATKTLTSLAVADTLSLADGLVELLVGARRQEIESGSFAPVTGFRSGAYDRSAVTPALGLVVRPTAVLSLYVNRIEGLTALTAPNTAVNTNQTFPPARARQYEIGAKVDFETFGATLSAFQITQPTGFTDPLTRVFGVIGAQRNRGLEGTVFGALAPGLRLLGGAAFLDARLTRTRGGVYDGNPAAGAPRIQVNAGLEWDVPTADGLTAIAQLVQTGAAYSGTPLANGPSRQSVPDWTTVDLGLRYTTRLQERPVTLRATVTNVADRRYWIVNPYGALILGAPRTAWLSAAVDF